MGDMNKETAELIQIHSNWQFREQIADFKEQMVAGLMGFLGPGDVTFHSYFDDEMQMNRHVYLTMDEFVTPFTMVSRMPDYGDIPHYCKVLRYYRHQMQAMKGKWFGVDEVLEEDPSWDDEPEKPIRQGQAEVVGEEMPSDLSGDAPYTLLQYEGWLELPHQDKDRWCQVILDYRSHKVLSLKVHEEADWQDRVRFEQQQTEMTAYQAQMGQYQRAQAQHDEAMNQVTQGAGMVEQAHAAGEMPPEHAMGAVQHLHEMMPPPLPPPPLPPSWLGDAEKVKPPRMVPIRMFSHGKCFPPMSGSIGIGLGMLLADYNRAANVALSQFVDQATLGNAKGLIVADTVDFERPFSWAPGKINKAKGVSGIELKNAIMPLDPGAANPQLLQLVQLMQSNGSAAAQAPDVLSGESGKSGETYRGIATRIEQATKQLTVLGGRYVAVVTQVLKNNARLNAVFLRDEELFEVTQDAAQTMGPMKITRDLYQRGYKFELTAKMDFSGTSERIAEADQILQMTTAFPPLMNDLPFFYQAVKGALSARRRRDLLPFLGPEAMLPPPQTPFGLMTPGPVGPPPPGQGGPPSPNQKGPEGHPPNAGPEPPKQNNPQGPGGPAAGPPPPNNPPPANGMNPS
jgi:hypothetical protein